MKKALSIIREKGIDFDYLVKNFNGDKYRAVSEATDKMMEGVIIFLMEDIEVIMLPKEEPPCLEILRAWTSDEMAFDDKSDLRNLPIHVREIVSDIWEAMKYER